MQAQCIPVCCRNGSCLLAPPPVAVVDRERYGGREGGGGRRREAGAGVYNVRYLPVPCAVRHFLPKRTDDGRTTARLANHNPMWCCLRAPPSPPSLPLCSRLSVQRQLPSAADSTAPVTTALAEMVHRLRTSQSHNNGRRRRKVSRKAVMRGGEI